MKRRILNHPRKDSLFILAYSFTYSPFTFFNSKLRKWKDVRVSVFAPLRWLHAPSPIYLFCWFFDFFPSVIGLCFHSSPVRSRSFTPAHSLRLSSHNSIPFASRLRIPFPSPISPRKAYSWSLISVESQDYWFFLLLFLFSRSFTFLFYHSVIKETEPQPFSFCSCELFFLSQ